jgi:ubiquitin C-terminal hydrolase
MSEGASEFRELLRANRALVHDLKGRPQSRKIYLVPIDWHIRLIQWLDGDRDDPPGPIDNSILLINGELNPLVRFKQHFRVVEADIWPSLTTIFPCPNPIARRIGIHPLFSTTTVIMKPIILEMYIPCKGILCKTVSDEWTFQDIRRPLCTTLHLIYSDHCFVDWSTNESIDDYQSIGSFAEKHGTKVKLQSTRAVTRECGIGGSQASIPPMPLLTFPALPGVTKGDRILLVQTRRGGTVHEIRWPRPVGLANAGNDCYFIAGLQCLIRVPLLATFVLGSDYHTQINTQNPAGSGGAVARAFRLFVDEMCVSSLGPVRDCRKLKAVLSRSHPEFLGTGQHDAQEILCALIDMLHEDLCRFHTVRDGLTPRSRHFHAANPTRPNSVIGDMMYGQFLTTLACPNCGNRAQVYDPFLFISVPIPENCAAAVDLMELVRVFVSSDELDRDNLWMCSNCSTRVQAARQTVIFEAPKILIFHLKRFASVGGVLKKVSTAVKFPDRFEMGTISRAATGTYKLLGVVMHSGALSSGHYTSASVDPLSGKWFMFNDSFVSPASEDHVHSTRAYVLFYQKID